MVKLHEIESAITRMNSAAFQDLADAYLAKLHPEWSLLSRSGSQLGKQQTIKGTPDSIFISPTGKFILVQHSTAKSNVTKKINDDVKKCFDPSKTGIPKNRIESIVICTSFRPSQNQLNAIIGLNSYVYLYAIDKMTQDIFLHYPDLANNYLNIELATSELLEIGDFIKKYDSSAKKLATPLNIPFKYRESILKEIIDAIQNEDIIVLGGSAGTGKTKLAVETCLRLTSSMKCFALNSISDSCKKELDSLRRDPCDILLFIDDVHRISQDIIEAFLENYLGKGIPARKIIFTVRDYVLDGVIDIVKDYRYKNISIPAFTDDEITGIISGDPFNIRHTAFQSAINDIAKGNPRLAIMASLLALETNSLESLHNVADLFGNYYSRVEKDVPFIKEALYIKVLGLLGFFHHIELNASTLDEVLTAYKIGRNDFIEACHNLFNCELVDIYSDIVKISEQNLGLYYFYKAFFVDGLLSFDTLLELFFTSHVTYFKDTIIPITNLYGYKGVKDKIESSLNSYSDKVPEEHQWDFYETFYFFIPEHTLTFVLSHLTGLVDITNVTYQTEYNNNDFIFSQHNDLQLLGRLCRNHLDYITSCLEIMLDIVRKRPDQMPRLIYTLKESFNLGFEDRQFGYIRQKKLLEFFKPLILNDSIALTAFPEVAKMLLSFSFHDTKGGRGNSFTFTTINIGLSEDIKFIREQTWEMVSLLPTYVINTILSNYGGIIDDVSKPVVKYDCQYVNHVIDKHLCQSDFSHCLTIRKLKNLYKRLKIRNTFFLKRSQSFTNPAFEMYVVFTQGNRYPGIKNWERLVRKTYLIKDQKDQDAFIDNYRIIASGTQSYENYRFNEALDYIVDETMRHCFSRGLSLFRELIPYDYHPHLPFRNHMQLRYKYSKIWDAIKGADVQSKLHFFANLPQKCITNLWRDRFLLTVKSLTANGYLRCEPYQELLVRHPIVTEQIIQHIVDTNLPILDEEWIEYALENYVPLDLVEKSYLVCQKKSGFDYQKTSLIRLLQYDKSFLNQYLESFKNDDEIPALGFLWSLENNEMMISAFDYMIEHNWELFDGIYEKLFESIPNDQLSSAQAFLLAYVKSNYMNHKKMNAVVKVVVSKMPGLRRSIVCAFLNQTTDVALFETISWTIPKSVVYSGNVNPGEIEVKRWEQLLEDVNSSKLGAKLIPICTYIKQQMTNCQKSIDYFRRLDYIDR